MQILALVREPYWSVKQQPTQQPLLSMHSRQRRGVSNTASATATDSSGMPVNDISDDGDDTDGNTPTINDFDILQDPVDGDTELFNGMSPGDDGINDYLKIAGIEKYPNNTVKIFNRWGVLVYETKGYGLGDRLFMGISEGRITITK